jgi:ferrous iron transport protein A
MDQPMSDSAVQTLADLLPGQAATVVTLHNEGLERRRMMDLGLVPGTRVWAEFNSPMGDPVAYRVRGAVVALRHKQARQILIDNIETEAKR